MQGDERLPRLLLIDVAQEWFTSYRATSSAATAMRQEAAREASLGVSYSLLGLASVGAAWAGLDSSKGGAIVTGAATGVALGLGAYATWRSSACSAQASREEGYMSFLRHVSSKCSYYQRDNLVDPGKFAENVAALVIVKPSILKI